MTTRDRLSASLKDALRNRNALRVATLRLMLAALKDREIAARGEDGRDDLDDAEITALFSRMVKQREDAIQSYEQAGRMELAEQEREEIKVIREFLPTPLDASQTEAAIAEAIEETGANSIRDMGRVMAALKARYAGRLDFAAAGAAVKKALA